MVLKVDSKYLLKRHNQLMQEHDATYDYDEYIPHITLSYDIGKLRKPQFPKDIQKELHLCEEYVEDLKLEWKPKQS